jgi:hypothetical protein
MAKGFDPRKNARDLAIVKANLNEIAKLYERLGEQNPFEGMKAEDFDVEKFKELQVYLSDAKSEADSLFGAMDRVKEEVDEIFGGLNAITDEITKGKQGFALTKKTVKTLTGIMGDVKDITDGIVEGNSEDLEKLLLKAQAEEKNLVEAQSLLQAKVDQGTATAQEVIALENVNGLLEKQDGLYGQITDAIDKVREKEVAVEKAMGGVGVAVDSVKGALDTIGMGSLGKAMGLDTALANTKKLTKEAINTGKPFNAMGHLTKEVGANLAKAFGPLAIALAVLGKMVEAFKVIDKASGEIAKSQGISAAEGRELVALANQQALATGDILVSTKDIVAAQAQLNSVLGTSTQFPAEMAVDMNTMAEKLGLSAEAQNFFAKNALKGKGAIMDQLQGVSDVVMRLNEQTGLTMNLKDIQEGIGKLTASQRLSARGNTEELANQVYQTKLLGLEASDLEGVQNNLLDFEKSIQAEMEAELMTGKQLNLDRARALALQGKQGELAAEIKKQVGDIAEFEEMNVLQRQSLAAAFGLTVDQMAEMLEKQKAQEMLSKAGFKSQSKAQEAYNALVEKGLTHEEATAHMKSKGLDDALAAQLKSANQQEKMNALTEKLSDIFIGLMGPLMTLLDPVFNVLVKIVGIVTSVLTPAFQFLNMVIEPILQGLQGMFDIISAIFDPTKSISDVFEGMSPVVTFLSAAFAGMGAAILVMNAGLIKSAVLTAALAIKAGIVAAAKMAAAAASTLGLGMVPILAGIAAGAIALKAAQNKATQVKDAVIPPGGGPIMSGPAGTVQFDPNDTIVAGTNLGGGQGSGEVITLLKELISAVKEGGDVFIDGNKVGKSLTLATSRMGN